MKPSQETAFTFPQKQMIGIIHHPEKLATDVGLLIVVGGPQYRIGAHRQYVHLARFCAEQGIAAMRFDYQGVGDSDGSYPGFEQVSGDIHSAIDAFLKRVPGIRSVAIWGLCEGASAILLGGANHKAVSHIILANPWVRTDSGLAKATIKHYYLDRLKDRQFWRKIFSGNLGVKAALTGFFSNLRQAFASDKAAPAEEISPFPERMRQGLQDFQGKSLLIMSGNDLVAREFDDLTSSDKIWQQVMGDKNTDHVDITDSDHTFSTEKWRQEVAEVTANWLISG